MENVIDLKKFDENRISIKDILSKEAGSEVEFAGWIYNSRALGKVRFFMLKDITSTIQVVGFKGATEESVFDLMDSLSRESVVYIKGIVKDSKQAPGGKEIDPIEMKLVASADDLPIDVSDISKTELHKRLDSRFVDLHRRNVQSIFKIESTIMQAYRKFMVEEVGAIEAQFPSIIGSSSEGGTELFTAKYFERDAYLSQSCQLYKQMLACSMEKVFTIFTVWRAEKHNTVRHLNEARQMDYEQAFADEFVIMDVLGKCVQYIVKEVLEKNKEDLELLKIDLKVPEVKYFKFKEVKELMDKEGVHCADHDLSTEAEKKLGELFPETIVMVHDWPIEGKPFYIMPKGDGLSGGFDAIYKGTEITSGGQRIHVPGLLEERLRAKDLNPEDFKEYIDSFRYGAPPHAGFGMGLERLTMLMLGLDNIREVVLFPRDKERLTP